jgi:hypothetical protein
MTFRKFIAGLFAMLVSGMASIGFCEGVPGTASSNEYALKAAFVFNFSLYTEWPVGTFEPSDPMTLCVLGDDPIRAPLDALRRKQAQGKRVQTRHLSNVSDAKGCNVLFVASSEHANLARIAATLQKQPILTVAEKRSADARFPIMLLVPIENRLTFDINHTTAKAAGLTLSSNLLRLARDVK